MNTQDFWAVRWYGLLWRLAVEPVKGSAKMWYRADISFTSMDATCSWELRTWSTWGQQPTEDRMKQEEQRLLARTTFLNTGRQIG